MHCLLISVLLLWMTSDECASAASFEFYQNIRDDLQGFNISCNPNDSCNNQRYEDTLQLYACNCGVSCVQLDTCCPDSRYVHLQQPELKPTCRSVYMGASYFMVDRCPSSDSVFESQCREEWNGKDDVLRMVPVTSLYTAITYKNYFCFRCHESNDEIVYWNVQLVNHAADENTMSKLSNRTVGGSNVSLEYDHLQEIWTASFGKEDVAPIPVKLSVQVPLRVLHLLKDCKKDIVSNCSNQWTDMEVAKKCQAYMDAKTVNKNGTYLKYRNAHCALCNFEDLNSIACGLEGDFAVVSSFAPQFSFVHLLDVNPAGGDEVGRARKCQEDHIWDPYAKKCREVSCIKPGHKVVGGKCVKE